MCHFIGIKLRIFVHISRTGRFYYVKAVFQAKKSGIVRPKSLNRKAPDICREYWKKSPKSRFPKFLRKFDFSKFFGSQKIRSRVSMLI